MRLTIGSTSFEITTKPERERDLKIGFYLLIKVPRASIGAEELRDLLDGNTEVITVTKDDGTEEQYEGFNKVEMFNIEATEYVIKQACMSEAMAQISILKDRANKAESKNTELTADMGMLAETAMLQTATIESLLLDVIPTVVADAVTVAMEELLTEKVSEVIEE